MHYMHKVLRLVTSSMGTSSSYKALTALKSKNYRELVSISPRHPDSYARAEEYADDAQLAALFKKLEGLPTGIDLAGVAEHTFIECEQKNRVTNNRLARYVNWFERGFEGDSVDEKLYVFLKDVRKIVADIVGSIPMDLEPGFGKGSTFLDRGREITIPHKMGSRPTVTADAEFLCNTLVKGTKWWHSTDFSHEVVRGNRFTTVNKDSTKDRGICIEPSYNLSYQLAVGRLFKKGIRLVTGIELKGEGRANAQMVHRELAKLASVSGLLATLDLSNASDLVCYMLVKLLFPKRWFELMCMLRSPETYFRGNWVKLQKFSSMGNGYTFEMETIIFYALSKACSPTGIVKTYGDDMIVPVDAAPGITACLGLFGLEINHSKSFSDRFGEFRESCGGDYFRGKWVRPIYFRKIPATPLEWMELHNSIVQLIRLGRYNDTKLLEACHVCYMQVPAKLRLCGPYGVSGVFWNHYPDTWRVRNAIDDNGDRGYMEIMTLQPDPIVIPLTEFSSSVQLASALLKVPSRGPTPRDAIRGYKRKWQAAVMLQARS